MKRLALLLPLLSLTVLALPSGKKWFFPTCTTTCTGSGNNNLLCVSGRCLPKVRFASSVGNSGGMTINGPSAVPYGTALTSMRAAFEVWTTPNVTSCSTSMGFAFQPEFATPTGTTAINGNDGNNSVIWLGGTSWRYGSGTLGLTTTTFYPGQLTDADMELNNNSRWGTTGGSSDTDLQSVVTHEAGHFIGFAHTTTSTAVMNPSIAAGVQLRTLRSADLSDVCGVYPGTTGGQGTACTTGGQCTSPLVCEGASGSTTLLCTQNCAGTGSSCPAGYSCQASTSGFACLPAVGAVDQCRFCLSGADCSTGACIESGSGLNYCSQACTVGMAGQCATGSTCAMSGGGTFCVPTGACTNQCTVATVAADCAPGYACQGGTCTPTGALGDRCEASGFCQACGTCVADTANPNIAFCRACCNGLGACAGCTSTTCGPVGGNPTACGPVPVGQERVCFPTTAPGLCQACDATTPCGGGNVCVSGTCHAGCDPSSPGTCPACLYLGTGSICACTAEIAEVDQACSPSAPLGICRTGLVCMGGSCRRSCAAVPCDASHTCTDLAGQLVCIPGVIDAGPTGGGGGGAGGGTATGGGGGSSTAVCGASTCGGCCDLSGQCQQPTAQACGTFGGQCVACTDTETCELGACVKVKPKGCGCTSFEGASALLLVLALTRRRKLSPSPRGGEG